MVIKEKMTNDIKSSWGETRVLLGKAEHCISYFSFIFSIFSLFYCLRKPVSKKKKVWETQKLLTNAHALIAWFCYK